MLILPKTALIYAVFLQFSVMRNGNDEQPVNIAVCVVMQSDVKLGYNLNNC